MGQTGDKTDIGLQDAGRCIAAANRSYSLLRLIRDRNRYRNNNLSALYIGYYRYVM
jgi:hypothetical protein